MTKVLFFIVIGCIGAAVIVIDLSIAVDYSLNKLLRLVNTIRNCGFYYRLAVEA